MRFGNAAITLTCKNEKIKNQNIFYEVCEGILFGETSKPFDITAKLWKLWTEDFRYFLQSSEYRTWVIQNSILYYVCEDRHFSGYIMILVWNRNVKRNLLMVRLSFKVAAFDVDISTSENLAFDSQLLCLVS